MKTSKFQTKKEKGLFNKELSQNALDTLETINSFSKENYFNYLDEIDSVKIKNYFDYSHNNYTKEMTLLCNLFKSDYNVFNNLLQYLKSRNLTLLPCFCLNFTFSPITSNKPRILNNLIYNSHYVSRSQVSNIIFESYVIYIDDYALMRSIIQHNNITLSNLDMNLITGFTEKRNSVELEAKHTFDNIEKYVYPIN